MVWKPVPEEAEYYSIPSPADKYSALGQILFKNKADPTWGRQDLPRWPDEILLRSQYGHRDGKIVTSGAVSKEKEWVTYQVWEPPAAADKGADLVMIHGINDFGGKWSAHCRGFLDAGYRIISPDLPSHGRSTGIHVDLPEMDVLPTAVYKVLVDVLKTDAASGPVKQKRKIFLAGASLGGFVAVMTCLKYGSSSASDLPPEGELVPEISGGLFLCPMLAIASDSRPHWSVELLARAIASFAGSLPLAAANKGNNSEDPTCEEQFFQDPGTYHGKLRVGTGLAILRAIDNLNREMSHLTVPFALFHGTGDRVTSYKGSEKLYKEASSTDKKLFLYEGYEHILVRVGKDEKDDYRRQRVLGDMLQWLNDH
ncbi:lysophospholipase [Meredithblackwellia eburnea MCA 4105]